MLSTFLGCIMREIKNLSFDAERALYGERGILVNNCRFDGEADGESALKECRDIRVDACDFRLRYPLWHVHKASISNSKICVKRTS